jgi:hypothetical protein
MVEQHPMVHAAFAAGAIDGWRALVIVDELRPV